MAYVITESCIGCKHGTCVDVCPVDCIHPAPDEAGFAQASMLYIDGRECIDCDACAGACPEGAPMSSGDARGASSVFIEINRVYAEQGLAAAEALVATVR